MRKLHQVCLVMLLISLAAGAASAQSFRVQCPTSTITHPATLHDNNLEPAYTGPTVLTSPSPTTFQAPSSNVNGAIKCQQVSGGDGYATMADGTQTYMFSFGPLSGLADIAAGQPGTEFPNVFNTTYPGYNANPPVPLLPGDPATTAGASDDSSGYNLGTTPPGTPGAFSYNGAVGLVNDIPYLDTIFDISEVGLTVTVILNAPSFFKVGDQIIVAGTGTRYDNSLPATTTFPATPATWTVTAINVSNAIFS